MKLLALSLGLLSTFSAFATEIDGINISCVPTASKVYQDRVADEYNVPAAKKALIEECKAGKAQGEDFARKNGYKIISSKGCERVKETNMNGDQNADGIELSTSFEVLFK